MNANYALARKLHETAGVARTILAIATAVLPSLSLAALPAGSADPIVT